MSALLTGPIILFRFGDVFLWETVEIRKWVMKFKGFSSANLSTRFIIIETML